MISRRNIRIKVMQCLYAAESESTATSEMSSLKLLKSYLDQTAELFAFCIFSLTEIARYAETDAKLRSSKHLPSYEDLHVNIKIAGNSLLWKILETASFQTIIKQKHFAEKINQELIRKIYYSLVETELYKIYINEESRDKKSEKELLSFIFTDLMMANEEFTDFLEEHFLQWDDDAEMIYQMVLNYLSKPAAYEFNDVVGPEKTNYALTLLKTAIEKKDYTMEMIKPKLNNWDPDRIAALDMIMLRMGICEFLYFETIPTKVTINEYIDLAKSYSTQQSGQFINGILDSIHKELQAAGSIKKVEFKKQS
ncbi:MAG: transcription antitermination factor NusB [Bacteroidetes bacterium]|nr:transcription antitermination factor NusB [Bacteroidota bacterium]